MKVIERVEPVYPARARQLHITGMVRLEVLVGENGAAKMVRVISGHPLLVRAAAEAVKQWRFVPTLLNGWAIEAYTRVEVWVGPSRNPPHQPRLKKAIVHAAQVGNQARGQQLAV